MSVIGATRLQFKKSAFAEEVVKHLVLEPEVHDLFSAATSIETTSHIIAAIVGSETPELLEETSMSDLLIFNSLFTCLRVLFVKQVQGADLSQGEQQIVSLANRFAKKLASNENSMHLQGNIKLVIKLYKQLQTLARAEVRSKRSMC
ncbi:hypothetical protein [Shewanella kaireitica]|uniref:hypothetical protein n=1 Tax=Shewanella kaireitica TaxID=212021 RepID=UPI00200C6170|nr:hypothetical protein [Shewanella kaireitica]MCL1093032.1 hypothetical protein [Shewanella kaireitica]